MNCQTFKMNIEHLTGETKQNKIADVLHVSPSKLSKWFTGESTPTFSDILDISKRYHCSIDWLVGNEFKQKTSSVYDVCQLIVELDSMVYMGFHEESEITSYPFYDYANNAFQEREVKRNYISMHIKDLPAEIYRTLDKSTENYDSTISVFEESHIINEFLKKYAKLRKAYQEGYIDEYSFHHMVVVFLDELPKEPLHYIFDVKPEVPIE